MENNKIFISITLLPKKDINEDVLELNNSLSKKFPVKRVDNVENDFAHISLYNANFPEKNRALVEISVKEISEKFSKIELIPKGINIKSRFVSVVFQKNSELEKIQDEIIEILNSLRGGLVQSKYIEKPEFYTAIELEYAHKYGYPFCKDQFSPHMTIAEFEDTKNIENVKDEITWNKSFEIEKLSLRVSFKNESGERLQETKLFDLSN